jgi:hypothetical protein
MTRLTKKDVQTIRRALNDAMDERDSFAAAYEYRGPEAEAAMQRVRDYEALHVKLFGQPSARAAEIKRLAACPTIPITSLMAGKPK